GGDQAAVARERQRVDLDRERVVGASERVELHHQRCQLRLQRTEPRSEDEVAYFERQRPAPRVGMEFGNRFGMGLRYLLDLHAALGAENQHGLARIAVEGEPQIELARDLLGGLAEDLLDGVALDRHPQDLAGDALGIGRGFGELDASGLAASPDRDLRLDGDRAQGPGGERRLVRGARQPSVGHGDPGRPKALLHLVLEKLHKGIFPWRRRGRSTCFSLSRWSDRISVGRVSWGSMTSSRKPRSAATYGLANFSL